MNVAVVHSLLVDSHPGTLVLDPPSQNDVCSSWLGLRLSAVRLCSSKFKVKLDLMAVGDDADSAVLVPRR
jgi:hypothetical protein